MAPEKQRQYYTQKHDDIEFETVTFRHPDFADDIRLVLNCTEIEIFKGEPFIPVAAELQQPEAGAAADFTSTISFPRAYVGDEIEAVLNSLDPYENTKPIEMILEIFSENDRNKPMQHYELYIDEDGIRFGPDTVQITAANENPGLAGYYKIYTEKEYPGLRDL